ncbi:MAG: DNA-directed RNA polymerase subunit alpha [Clostridia bacterium]|nr:DNA-directed RNA polymerase subunit alpha [Clostridia bacterium]
MIEFIAPTVIPNMNENERNGRVELYPLARGYATTIGNALRRVLLNSIPGTAVTKIQIEGNDGPILHEFTTIPGVREDVVEIILNIKSIVAKMVTEEPANAYIDVVGPCVVTDGDIKSDYALTMLNPDHCIATVSAGYKLHIDLTFEQGNGYVSSAQNKERYNNSPIGTLFVDSIYTPVQHVNYAVEGYRVGQDLNYEKLILEVSTNGAQTVNEAVAYAAGILNKHLAVLEDLSSKSFNGVNMKTNEDEKKASLSLMKIEELELTVRSYNCLSRAGIFYVEELTKMTASDLMHLRNLGKKSFDEITSKIKALGLSFKDEF